VQEREERLKQKERLRTINSIQARQCVRGVRDCM
jgi:hypothetical protein